MVRLHEVWVANLPFDLSSLGYLTCTNDQVGLYNPRDGNMSMYHSGNRELQEHFDSTRLADRLVERLWHDRFKDDDKAFIEGVGFFFLATADAAGRPDCSFKGGPPGFVKVPAPDLLVYPDYDGNGMFKSMGNIKVNPHVGLLFMLMGEKPKRLRVNGRASVHVDDPMMADLPGAQIIVRIVPEHIFPNCPRYIPDPERGNPSEYLPVEGAMPKEPAWKGFEAFKDVVPPRRR
jgi:predicted pyridoxine 5'-phosphate oxidase superfamily flavin-nucleotide-binding protein